MHLHITEAEVASLVDTSDAIDILDRSFRDWNQDNTANLPRQRVPLRPGMFNVMPAAVDRYFGLKSYFLTPAGRAYHVMLYARDTARLVALIEANTLSQLRTGAASGVATRHMAAPDAAILGQIGTGKQAVTQLEAVCAVRPITHVRVFSRDAGRREAFAAQMQPRISARIEPVETAEACVTGADIVTTITKSAEPVFSTAWLAPDAHVNLAGANSPTRREVDAAICERAALVATDDRAQAKLEAPEFSEAVAAGIIDWKQIVELGDIISGRHPSRPATGGLTVFKSLGVATEDIALAGLIYERALAARE